jgi:hypothetical protein
METETGSQNQKFISFDDVCKALNWAIRLHKIINRLVVAEILTKH